MFLVTHFIVMFTDKMAVLYLRVPLKNVRKVIYMGKKSSEPMIAKSCFGHLGGNLGGLFFKRMIELKWFKPIEGKTNVYGITEKGYQEFSKLGVDLSKLEGKIK